MKITTSKQFAIDARDLLKGAAVAAGTAGIASAGQVLELWIDSGSLSIKEISYKLVLKAAFGAFGGYLFKNFMSGSKVVAKVQAPETLEEVKEKVEEVK